MRGCFNNWYRTVFIAMQSYPKLNCFCNCKDVCQRCFLLLECGIFKKNFGRLLKGL